MCHGHPPCNSNASVDSKTLNEQTLSTHPHAEGKMLWCTSYKALNINPQLLINRREMLEKCPEMAECYVDIVSAAHFSHAAQELNAKLEPNRF